MSFPNFQEAWLIFNYHISWNCHSVVPETSNGSNVWVTTGKSPHFIFINTSDYQHQFQPLTLLYHCSFAQILPAKESKFFKTAKLLKMQMPSHKGNRIIFIKFLLLAASKLRTFTSLFHQAVENQHCRHMPHNDKYTFHGPEVSTCTVLHEIYISRSGSFLMYCTTWNIHFTVRKFPCVLYYMKYTFHGPEVSACTVQHEIYISWSGSFRMYCTTWNIHFTAHNVL